MRDVISTSSLHLGRLLPQEDMQCIAWRKHFVGTESTSATNRSANNPTSRVFSGPKLTRQPAKSQRQDFRPSFLRRVRQCSLSLASMLVMLAFPGMFSVEAMPWMHRSVLHRSVLHRSVLHRPLFASPAFASGNWLEICTSWAQRLRINDRRSLVYLIAEALSQSIQAPSGDTTYSDR